jgi:drug/metabolite transporter (DMT)-like permease
VPVPPHRSPTAPGNRPTGPSTGGDVRAVLALLLVQLFFGTFSVFGKLALREMPPFVLASIRAVFGALLLTGLARLLAPAEPPFSRAERRTLVELSLLGIVANQLLFISGLARTTAVTATLLGVTIPLFTLAFAALSGAARPTARRTAGIPVALAGVLLLLDPRGAALGRSALAGNLLVLANCAAYSVFLVRAREILRRRHALSVVAACFRIGVLPILLLASPDLLAFRPGTVTSGAWVSVGCIVLFATVGAYSLNAWALARTGAVSTALFVYVQPLVAGVAARVALGESPGPRTFAAAGLIFAGLALGTLPGRRPD